MNGIDLPKRNGSDSTDQQKTGPSSYEVKNKGGGLPWFNPFGGTKKAAPKANGNGQKQPPQKKKAKTLGGKLLRKGLEKGGILGE